MAFQFNLEKEFFNQILIIERFFFYLACVIDRPDTLKVEVISQPCS